MKYSGFYLLICLHLLMLPVVALSQPADLKEKPSDWNGGACYQFKFQGRAATVVVPKHALPGNPWIWRPAFFNAFPNADSLLLQKGFHITYYDVTHCYGSPSAVNLGNDFYNEMTRRWHLSSKVVLEGVSRGGYYSFAWAADNADKVACLYLDAPVCFLQSWPGRNDRRWKDALKEWHLIDAEITDDFRGNAQAKLSRLAAARVPIFGVVGDSDEGVPYPDNFKKVRDAYQEMGGVVEVVVKPGCGHHPHGLTNPEPIADFIFRYQKGYSDYQCVHQRSTLDNAFYKFQTEHRGVVAFLGGSITEMKGWRNMIKDDLRQRFPYTEFQFIEAGISSLGSTPHAFRFSKDVLQKGTPDLLFLEAAVNDATNGFTSQQQIRAMEGIVKQAWRTNPMMDIVMMHFEYDPFIPEIQSGKQPSTIVAHEQVAAYYGIPSLNLAHEVALRIQDGQFTWDDFGGVHPHWNGSKYYAATINRLFDLNTRPLSQMKPAPHLIPQQPLDSFNYERGHFVDIREAMLKKGFRLVSDWTPTDSEASTRAGFVHVPMLESLKKGAELQLQFTGRAIGIFCVAGPHASVLDYSIDGAPFKQLITRTEWSDYLYLPWVYLFETELQPGPHQLRLKTGSGTCQIRNFVVNE